MYGIGKKVSEARRAMGENWTQDRLMAELQKKGVKKGRAWISSLESGRVKRLSTESIKAMSAILGKPASYFKEDEEPKAALYTVSEHVLEKLRQQELRIKALERRVGT